MEISPEARSELTRRPIGQAVVMRQEWKQLLFLHWPVPAEAVQRLLPPGLTVDTHEGVAYIGLVPFTMRNVRPVWSPAVPGLSHFHEINVRTYVHVEDKGPGVWFFSLDAANFLAVQIARASFHLPYYFARMRVTPTPDGGTRYLSRRAHPRTPTTHTAIEYAPSGTPRPAEPGTLAYFLCERYLLYAYNGRRLLSGRVHHTPYPLQNAVLHELSDTLVAASGFPELQETAPPLIHYASGVSVEVFGLRAAPLAPIR